MHACIHTYVLNGNISVEDEKCHSVVCSLQLKLQRLFSLKCTLLAPDSYTFLQDSLVSHLLSTILKKEQNCTVFGKENRSGNSTNRLICYYYNY
jgi:hypothetical protein